MHELDPASPFEAPTVEPQPRRPWLISFADLICVLLSFFVLLANMSKFEHDKARNAMQSLGASLAFGTSTESQHVAVGKEGDAVIGAQAARDRLSERIRAVFPAAVMDNLPAGNLLRFSVPVAKIFDGNALKDEAQPLVSAIAGAARQGAPGFRFEVETVAGEGTAGEADAATAAIAHASALARELAEKGAPKGLVSAGLDNGDAGLIRVTIRARAEDEPRIDFRRIAD